MKRILAGLIAAMAFLAGCSSEPSCGNTKDAFLDKYHALIDKATEANLALSDAEWKKYDEQFRAYVEECYGQYEAELAGKERRRFWSRAIKYYVQRYGDGILHSAGQVTDKTGQRISEEVKKFWKNPLKAYQKNDNDSSTKAEKRPELIIRKKGEGLEEE